MCCFVILLLSNEMQMSVRRFSAIPHLRASSSVRVLAHGCLRINCDKPRGEALSVKHCNSKAYVQ